MPATLLALALATGAQSALPRAAEAAGGHGGAGRLRLGGQVLRRCERSPLAYCGTMPVPLDPASPGGPDISVAYRFYPAGRPGGRAEGTVVPVEGGPGYASIGSVLYSSGGAPAGYGPMYGPLLERWNMLVVDDRGTGRSTPLECPALQAFEGATATPAFQRLVGECGESLDRRWRYPDGAYVHASDLFGTAPATADLAAVIHALGLGPVDLYGDSYGSFFAQAFAVRHPEMIRSLILDSTYPTLGLDPWYRSTVQSLPADFQAACSRAPACASAAPGSVWGLIGQLAASLRATPVSGVVPGPKGTEERVTMGVVGLVDLVNDASEDTQVYRGLDAAAGALLQEGDPAPLLRLYAQRLAVDEAYFGKPASEYSVGLYFASACVDYPQLFDMSAPPATRSLELAEAESSLPAGTFGPFTTAEWLAQDENTEAYSGCLQWPAVQLAEPPVTGAPPLLPPSMPVLVLGGELDAWTPPAGVGAVLEELGGDSRFVELANSTHVVGEGATECGSELVRAFVEDPGALATLDSSCAPAVPPIHSVGSYPERLEQEQPLQAAAGIDAPAAALRLAAAAVQTAGDAIARYVAIEAAVDRGLHGGSVTARDSGRTLLLHRDELVPGVPVSGTVRLSPAPSPEAGQGVLASLAADVPGLGPASISASWTTAGAGALASVSGEVAGRAVAGTMPAP